MIKKSIISLILAMFLSISISFSVITNANAKTILPAKSYSPIPITSTMRYYIKPKKNTSTRNKLSNFAKKFYRKNINYFTNVKRQKHDPTVKPKYSMLKKENNAEKKNYIYCFINNYNFKF